MNTIGTRQWLAFGCVFAAMLCGVSTVRGQCECNCDENETRVCGRVIYEHINPYPELDADGITSTCCEPQEDYEAPGCDDTSCENAVCAIDPTCVSDAWDEGCVDLARQLCPCLPTATSYLGNCIGPLSSIFVDGLADGEPVPFVIVELEGSTGVEFGEDITDEDGNFCICTGATPQNVRVKARNDYVVVKASTPIGAETDDALSKKFKDEIAESDYENEEIEVGTLEIHDTYDIFEAHSVHHPLSRAFHVCRIAQRSATHIELLAGGPMDSVTVRIGYPSPPNTIVYADSAYYDEYAVLGETIHLPGDQAAVMWHEYGHRIENKLGSFGFLPDYTNGHAYCCEQTNPQDGTANFCWAFFEGLASWYGAVNLSQFDGVAAFGNPPDFDGDGDSDWQEFIDCDGVGSNESNNELGVLHALGDNWTVETSPCGCRDPGGRNDCDNDMNFDGDGDCDDNDSWAWGDPRGVESVVASVLWDLIDTHGAPTEIDVHSTGVDEVAQIPIENVLTILNSLSIHSNNGECGGMSEYTYPASLEDFCNAYKDAYVEDPLPTVFPDLYSAYAFNLADLDCAADFSPPAAVLIYSGTHPPGVWRSNDDVEITILDRYDDMSGSYYYWDEWDEISSNYALVAPDTFDVSTSDFQSKATSACTPNTELCTSDVIPLPSPPLAEGHYHYYHVQSADMAGHLGEEPTLYGPVLIDLTKPQFKSLVVPTGDACHDFAPAYAISTGLHFEWEVTDRCPPANSDGDCSSFEDEPPVDPDCIPSGVDYVEIVYDSEVTDPFTVATVSGEVGSADVYLDPDDFPPVCYGQFSVRAYDRAGNVCEPVAPYLHIAEPFAPPCYECPDEIDPLFGERTVSGDVDLDGEDEVILSRGLNDPWIIIDPLPCLSIPCTSLGGDGMKGGDLFLADTDSDGDLDLIAAGEWPDPVGPPPPPLFEVRHFVNDCDPLPCGFTGGGAVPGITGHADMTVRVVDLDGNGEPILIVMGLIKGTATPAALQAYNFAGGAVPTLTGLNSVKGDFEVADVDADGDFDFVMAGTDATGDSGVFYFERLSDGTWTRHVVQDLEFVNFTDVDLGNWDTDSDIDLFVMYEVVTMGIVARVTRLYEFHGSEFVSFANAGNALAEGDGHIIDIYNDGYSEVLAMGRLKPPTLAVAGWQLGHEDFGHFGSVLPPVIDDYLLWRTDTAWGDFDADRSLDVFMAGEGMPVAPDGTVLKGVQWFRNRMSDCAPLSLEDYCDPNDIPGSPINLISTYTFAYDPAGGYLFSWDPPPLGDAETALLALGYELRLGSTPGANDVMTWTHPAGPSQQIAAQWAGAKLTRFVKLPYGAYYWSVRTVDSGWLRSAPAAEQISVATAIPPCDTIPGDCDGDGIADACEVDNDHDGLLDDCLDMDDDNDGVLDFSDVDRLDPDRCEDLDADGCDDCAVGTDDFGFRPDSNVAEDGVDADADGICDIGDPCPLDSPDDTDADSVCESNDACPGGNDLMDSDLDGIADSCDPCPADNPDDSDGDSVCNSADACPGSDDAIDTDRDAAPDPCDPCPLDADNDSDGDGVCDSSDSCPGGDDALDGDGDGFPDACDACPADNPNDSDYDTICDSADVCPGGYDFVDSDADGTPDYCEDCNGNGVADGQDLLDGSLCDVCLSVALGVDAVMVDCDATNVDDTCELDGSYDAAYGLALSVQDRATGFGDSNLGVVDFANGSELDSAHGSIRGDWLLGDWLYLLLTGNLESNFNKIEIFIDCIEGEGQNKLRGDNYPYADFNGLNRMGDDGSGNGLTFDADFAPDYWFSATGGNNPYELFVVYAELLTDGGGAGAYLGVTSAGGADDGVLSGGDNPAGIRATIDNSNIAGVSAGIGPDSGTGVTTGFEIAIPLAAIGDPTGDIRICVFINGLNHEYVSNQVLGSIGGANLGEPRDVDFSAIAGDQFFTVESGVDCNANDLADPCEVAHGMAEDVDGNGVLDECEEAPCEGDSNGDGTRDPLDAGYVQARFGCPVGTGDPDCDAADVNGDGEADPLDVGYVLARFGSCE